MPGIFFFNVKRQNNGIARFCFVVPFLMCFQGPQKVNRNCSVAGLYTASYDSKMEVRLTKTPNNNWWQERSGTNW